MRCRAGLERALEARRKERQLCRYREAQGLSEAIQPELTYAVDLALAAAYQAAQLYTEALDMYGAIVKAKLVPQARWGAGGQGLGLGAGAGAGMRLVQQQAGVLCAGAGCSSKLRLAAAGA
jgi:hypothetical protein